MNNAHRTLKVFLCHAHADRVPVCSLYAKLTKDGVDAWLDKEKLIPGQDWEFEIRKAVREADVVVVCLSKQFNKTGFRQKEVTLALDTAMQQPAGEIFIVPARLEECDTLPSLEKWHWVDLFESDGYEMLMRALRARANKIGVTMQSKRNWLPTVTSPRKNDGLISEKKPIEIKIQSTKSEEKSNITPKPRVEKLKPSKAILKRKSNAAIVVALIGLVGTVIAGLLSSPLIEKWLSPVAPSFTQTFEPITTQTPEPFSTSDISTEITPPLLSPTLDSTPLLTGLDNMSLILIPAGDFKMGSKGFNEDERPAHDVYLDAFYIDKTEVTNAMYEVCVSSGKCEAPRKNTSITQNESNNSYYYGKPNFDNYPVIYISWDEAKAYCKSVDRRLPTEAEWEKAASWDDAQDVKRIYPWGNTIDCLHTNYYADGALCVGDTTPVGSYPKGASFYGVLDMAGNVWEWVADRYDPEYYGEPDYSNPKGPASGDFIVIRGGSFLVGGSNGIRSSYREKISPDIASHNIGFRCAVDAP